MNVSELWLQEWVNPPLTGQQLAAQLTMAGLEVDGINPVAGSFNHVVVAHVLKTQPHPQADKLSLCEVNIGNNTIYQVVCGAANVRAGLNVAMALPGAKLPGDIHIKETMLRGQLSQGMLCSAAELGIEASSEGILELAEDAPLGSDLRAYLSLDDQVFDLNLTPNRADCFSIFGVAREVAALNQLPLPQLPSALTTPEHNELLTIQIDAPEGCAKYCGRIMRGINPHATTPMWIKERLRRAGVRAVHPVVDVTNYVMLELGQPMHAYDLATIEGDISVRYSKEHETLTLLDGQEVTFKEKVLLVADHTKPLAIAGIMGGKTSAMQSQTVDIFLESAFFNPIIIAGVARRHGLSSDSSQRNERGVDPCLPVVALERATALLKEIVGGAVGPINTVVHEKFLPSKVTILFNPLKVKQLSGLAIESQQMVSILRHLGMHVTLGEENWAVEIPTHRFDLNFDVDLVEEIIRFYGYDKIASQPMVSAMHAGKINVQEHVTLQSGNFLSARGYNETISYSFVDPQLQHAIYPEMEKMELLNPISPELSQMRAGMWPGLIASMVYNLHRQQTAIKFFETGVVFDVRDNTLQERACLAGLITGERGALNWSESPAKFDFYDLKGDLQALFSMLHLEHVQFVTAQHPALHPGQSARILVNNHEAGWIGTLHPFLLDELGLNDEVILFELTLSQLVNPTPAHYHPISKYPQIRRDLSLLVSCEVKAAQIEQTVREQFTNDWLKGFDIFDVYTGDSIPAGKKSVAIALTLQDDRRTLVDGEINELIGAIIKKLNDTFAIILRES